MSGPQLSEAEAAKAPSSSEEGVGGGGTPRSLMLERAAAMRTNPTEPEKRLWSRLRASRLGGHKFRRQAVIGGRIVDFFCPAKALIVEIDGDTHDRESDLVRDAVTKGNFGYCTIRFTNEDVMRNMDGVLMAVKEALRGQPDRWPDQSVTTPRPPPLKRRGSGSRQAKDFSHSGVEE